MRKRKKRDLPYFIFGGDAEKKVVTFFEKVGFVIRIVRPENSSIFRCLDLPLFLLPFVPSLCIVPGTLLSVCSHGCHHVLPPLSLSLFLSLSLSLSLTHFCKPYTEARTRCFMASSEAKPYCRQKRGLYEQRPAKTQLRMKKGEKETGRPSFSSTRKCRRDRLGKKMPTTEAKTTTTTTFHWGFARSHSAAAEKERMFSL